ncbi:MAG: hypothetical protein AAF497_05925 [Planctomycetota bacterium]
MQRNLLCLLASCLLAGPLFGQLAVTEIMWKSGHPEADPVTLLGGDGNGDWFELTNFGTDPINIEGYLFDDDDQLFGNDYAIWPNFEIQPNETVIILRENDANTGWRDVWGIDPAIRVLSECTSMGGDTFSGLSSGGDELNIYSPTAIDADGFPTGEAPIISITLPPATTGFSQAWDANGADLGLSVDGMFGAYTALDDGSGTMTAGTDVASPAYVEGIGTRLFPNAPHLNCPVEPGGGDFDMDGDYDCADVDALVAEMAAGTNDMTYDITGDGNVNEMDLEAWLAEAGAVNNASGGAFLPGDANLDGVVDVSDFNAWNAAKFTVDNGWCAGDFNGDGATDVSDFNLWNGNKFQSSDSGAAAVPEPTGLAMIAMALLSLCGIARRRR